MEFETSWGRKAAFLTVAPSVIKKKKETKDEGAKERRRRRRRPGHQSKNKGVKSLRAVPYAGRVSFSALVLIALISLSECCTGSLWRFRCRTAASTSSLFPKLAVRNSLSLSLSLFQDAGLGLIAFFWFLLVFTGASPSFQPNFRSVFSGRTNSLKLCFSVLNGFLYFNGPCWIFWVSNCFPSADVVYFKFHGLPWNDLVWSLFFGSCWFSPGFHRVFNRILDRFPLVVWIVWNFFFLGFD